MKIYQEVDGNIVGTETDFNNDGFITREINDDIFKDKDPREYAYQQEGTMIKVFPKKNTDVSRIVLLEARIADLEAIIIDLIGGDESA